MVLGANNEQLNKAHLEARSNRFAGCQVTCLPSQALSSSSMEKIMRQLCNVLFTRGMTGVELVVRPPCDLRHSILGCLCSCAGNAHLGHPLYHIADVVYEHLAVIPACCQQTPSFGCQACNRLLRLASIAPPYFSTASLYLFLCLIIVM